MFFPVSFQDRVVDAIETHHVPNLEDIDLNLIDPFDASGELEEQAEWRAAAIEEEHKVPIIGARGIVHDQCSSHEGQEDPNRERDVPFLHFVHARGKDEHRRES